MKADITDRGELFLEAEPDDAPGKYRIQVSASLGPDAGEVSYAVSEIALVKRYGFWRLLPRRFWRLLPRRFWRLLPRRVAAFFRSARKANR